VVGISLWKRTEAVTPILEPLPQDPFIQVYFNQSQASVYTEPYRHKTRFGDDLEQTIVDTIHSAQSSVDIAIHELHLPKVAEALKERHQAGVRVRVILEHDYSRPWSSINSEDVTQSEERDRNKYLEFVQLADQNRDGRVDPAEAATADSVLILQQAQIPLIDDTEDGSKGSGLMHHKFVVVDGETVLTGSVNYSISEVHGDFLSPESLGNANHLLKITSAALAQFYTEEFNLMWGDGPGGRQDSLFGLQKSYRASSAIAISPGSTITVQFSPTSPSRPWQQSVNGLIGNALNRATRAVDMALFVFSDQFLSNILAVRHQQGIQVRALIDPQFIYRDYSEALDMMGIALPNRQCRYEEGNQPWSMAIATVGMPQLPEGDILHHKFAVLDHQTVVTGSQNWSAAANNDNDENLLVIDNPTVAAHFQREFERLYNGATLGIPSWLSAKAQEEATRCRI
jgi:phosphatidylserine/phosphatidylglycerophosphate/cardiolipin synthase-like enzyme